MAQDPASIQELQSHAVLEFDHPASMVRYVGKKLGTSAWHVIDQTMVDEFARVTGDDQWIHVDIERAKRELPQGSTIAHGFLLLSLVATWMQEIYRIQGATRSINYGFDHLRFLSPVPVGSRVRLHQTLKNAEIIKGGVRLLIECGIEIENSQKPALVAQHITLALES
ncbi:MaoC family dehydratase [Microvirga sp. P5_D2]